ncbi:hypothetical protein QBC46DRAFT_344290 [Diplogelasinospora grovesii]|uniref:Uncharacterized protein n=1 Tax=Diplogelasinospora grovesii TaxID=303347 RepID=A0AAN6S276_9PEZI|nr:hypothetical protein QBC46DRAFT_344290 [Diplogelasinospora grovesii]
MPRRPQGQGGVKKHATGRALEEYIKERYPEVNGPAPAGKLSPVFVHCEGSHVVTDDMTGPKRSYDQVKIALDFAVDGYQGKEGDIANVVMGTAAYPKPGPGFTSNERRLKVMLTRRKLMDHITWSGSGKTFF